jgi:hypothetical protein
VVLVLGCHGGGLMLQPERKDADRHSDAVGKECRGY